MRRVLLVLSVTALMAAMLAVMAMPAFAKNSGTSGGGPPNYNINPYPGPDVHHNGGGGDTCVLHYGKNDGKQSGGGAYTSTCTY